MNGNECLCFNCTMICGHFQCIRRKLECFILLPVVFVQGGISAVEERHAEDFA